MSIRDTIFTTVAVALSAAALAGLLGTDAYSQAAGLEAHGVQALSMQIEMTDDECLRTANNRWAVVQAGGKP